MVHRYTSPIDNLGTSDKTKNKSKNKSKSKNKNKNKKQKQEAKVERNQENLQHLTKIKQKQ